MFVTRSPSVKAMPAAWVQLAQNVKASAPRKDGAENGIDAHGWPIAVRTRKPEMSLQESRQSPRHHVPLLMNTSKYSMLLTTLKSTTLLSNKHDNEAGTWRYSWYIDKLDYQPPEWHNIKVGVNFRLVMSSVCFWNAWMGGNGVGLPLREGFGWPRGSATGFYFYRKKEYEVDRVCTTLSIINAWNECRSIMEVLICHFLRWLCSARRGTSQPNDTSWSVDCGLEFLKSR